MCLTSPIFDLTAHFLSGNTVYFLCRFRAIRISHFDNFDRHAEDAIRQFKDRLHEGHPVDFQVSFLLLLHNTWGN